MPAPKLLHLYQETDAFFNKMQGLYLDAVAGFCFVHQAVQNEQEKMRRLLGDTEVTTEEFQDKRIFSYDMIFSKPICTSAIHETNLGAAKNRNAQPYGENYILLGQMCVVIMSDYWNEYLRSEWAIAKEVLPKNFSEIKEKEKKNELLRKYMPNDFWGDMNKLRNSILHHQGKANKDVSRCKVIKWFKPGESIILSPEHMSQIFDALLNTRNQIHSDSLPRRAITIT